jgi:hypothetical protein
MTNILQKKLSRIKNFCVINIIIQQRVGTDNIVFRKGMFTAVAGGIKGWYDKHKSILST